MQHEPTVADLSERLRDLLVAARGMMARPKTTNVLDSMFTCLLPALDHIASALALIDERIDALEAAARQLEARGPSV